MPSHELTYPVDQREEERELTRIDVLLDSAELTAHTLAERSVILDNSYDAAGYANWEMEITAQHLQIPPSDIRLIDASRVDQLRQIVQPGEKGTVIFMRHGMQSTDAHGHIRDEALRKISMMQYPGNSLDPITDGSVVEAIGMGVILNFLSQSSGKRPMIYSSRNARAAQVASLLSCATESHIHFLRQLTCPNYLPLPPERIYEILGPERKGTLPWQKDIVDRTCGEGTFDDIVLNMNNITRDMLHHQTFPVAITHTQQLNALGVQGRLDTLGLCVYQPLRGDPIVWPSGIFKPRNPDV